MTTTVPTPAGRTTTRPAAPQWLRAARFSVGSTTTMLRQGMFVFFTIALPIVMFLLFNSFIGSEQTRGTTVGTIIMINMAAYGGLGAAISAGAVIQLERVNGWLRQLIVAGLTPTSFVAGKLVAAMAVVLPALVGVLLAGVLLAGIRVSVPEAILVIAVLWATMLPMALLGLVIGLALRPSAVQPVATIGMMLLAVAGGLWFPVDMFPGWLQDLSALLPTHWMGVLGQWVITGEGAVGRGVITLAIWSVVLAVAAALLLGRAARTAPRR